MAEKIRVADYVVNRLFKSGVDHFFVIVGGNAMHLDDAIRVSKVPYTAFHNEQAATMAAEAYARVTGQLTCVVVTSGPGATNVVTGVAGAFYDSAPLFVICGSAKSSDLRTPDMPIGVRQVGTFELPIHDVCKSITKYSTLIHSADEVAEILDLAIVNCLNGRPGPSVINFPLDIQGEQFIEPAAQNVQVLKFPYDQIVSRDIFQYLVSELRKSTRPSVLIGHGVRASQTNEQLICLLEKLNLPIFTTQLAKDFVPYDNDLFVGHVGVRGDRPGNIGIHNSDFILCIGTSLHQQNIGYEPHLFAPNAKKFILEIDGSVLISSRAPIGLIALAGQDMATNQGVRSLILNDDQDPRFWFYLMKSSYKQLDAAGNGTTFRELRGSTMQEMTFQIPDLKTQTEIADYLNDLQLAADMSHKLATEVDHFMKEVAPMLVRSLVEPAN